MRRHRYPCRFRRIAACHGTPKRVGIFQEIVYIGRDEARLKRIRRLLPSRANIGGSLQRDADADFARRADHLFRQQISFFVRRAIRLVVQIVELADRGDPAQQHFEECHAGHVIDIVR